MALLPENFNAVQRKHGVGRNYRQCLGDGLRDENAVEGVVVVLRQLSGGDDVFERDGKELDTEIANALQGSFNGRSGEKQLASPNFC